MIELRGGLYITAVEFYVNY